MEGIQHRMSNKELAIVRFIVTRLTQITYSNNAKPIYERNLDRVMNDIFGVTRFCKKMSRGTKNEGTMIQLISQCDIDNLWKLTREGPHYNMLITLVAMDAKMDSLKRDKKKYADRGKTEKVKKTQKIIKKYEKTYKAAVKQFREIFDIHKDTPDRLLEKATSWLDRYDASDYDGYLFDLDEDDDDEDNYDSMMRYADRVTKGGTRGKKSKKSRGVVYGAFNLGGKRHHDDDEFNLMDPDYDDEEDDDDDGQLSTREMLEYIVSRIDGNDTKQNHRHNSDYEDVDSDYDTEEESGDDDSVLMMEALGRIIEQNQAINDRLFIMEQKIQTMEDDGYSANQDNSDYSEMHEVDITPQDQRSRRIDMGDHYDTPIRTTEDIQREMIRSSQSTGKPEMDTNAVVTAKSSEVSVDLSHVTEIAQRMANSGTSEECNVGDCRDPDYWNK